MKKLALPLVKDAKIGKPPTSALNLVEIYEKSHGFTAYSIPLAVDILFEMFSDEKCTCFLAFTANLMATGLRGVVAELIEKGYIDVVITTGGSLDHDVARSFGGKYYKGYFHASDEDLKRKGIHRLGNIFIPLESYGPLIEEKVRSLLAEITARKKKWSPSEIAREMGLRISDESSFLRAAALNDVPVFVPGIQDSAFGTQLFFYSQTNEFELDVLEDMKRLADIVFDSERTGALIIGGGISKHHVIWWNQFKEGLDYAVYLTTAFFEYDGSLSSARVEEAVTWGKVKIKAKKVNVYGDATVLLPLILSAVYEKMEGSR